MFVYIEFLPIESLKVSQKKIIESIIVSQFLRRVRAEVVYKVKPQQLVANP